MSMSPYFSAQNRSEQNMYEDITIEALNVYGQLVYYLPRNIVNEDRVLGDDIPSAFGSSFKLAMYIENVEGFDGEGDLFTRFGVEIRDEATFVVARRSFSRFVDEQSSEINSRPMEGDLIYLSMSKKLFQIMHVEHEQPFYQLNNLPIYKMRCQLFEYSGEDFDTNIDEIDDIESRYAYSYLLTLASDLDVTPIKGDTVEQIFADGVVMSGEVVGYNTVTNTLQIIHAGADDGKLHEFVTGININVKGKQREDSSVDVVAVVEDNQLSANEQNLDFTNETGFIDFSESNPFGEPGN